MVMNEKIYDIVIIGGGPAGLTAGLYAARGRMDTLLVESMGVMGQATMTEIVENYPGIDEVGGFELVDRFKKQAVKFGLECRQETVNKVVCHQEGERPVWHVEWDNNFVKTFSVIIASGASPKKLQIPGEEEFLGKGVSYCATCDGAFFRDRNIVVVGGGDTAVEEALFLTRFGKKVTLIHRKDRLRATKILQERAFANNKMEFVWDSVVKAIIGDQTVGSISVRNVKTGEKTEIACNGVFLFIGWHPNTGYLRNTVKLSSQGSIVVDSRMLTSAGGIFAAGDCCEKALHQIVTACGDGANAAYSAQQYVEDLKGISY